MSDQSAEQFKIEKQKLEELRLELEEKNKLTWQMSETLYKEKKRLESELSVLHKEKSDLEIQKAKNEEQVKLLWEQSTSIHKEKERIDKLKIEIEHRHKEMVDSVTYAKRIQEAILPELSDVNKALPDQFILFKPKDIISGDFYWFEEKVNGDGNKKIFIAAADCTGHGVPGALMSMLGTDKLNNAILHCNDTASLLSELNKGVKKVLRQTDDGNSTRDGMDIALCAFNNEMTLLEYSGANRPLWIVRSGSTEIEEIKATKSAIGGLTHDEQEFLSHTVALKKGDTIYIFSDGYADQFGSRDKKLMTKNFKGVLLEIQEKTMTEQKIHLDNFIETWRGSTEQTDDILVVGVRC